MSALLAGLWSRIRGYAALAGVALAALGLASFNGARRARREAARRVLRQDLDNRRTRDDVDRDVAARPDPAADLLRDWRRRE